MKTNSSQSNRCRLVLQGSAQACPWEDWLAAPIVRAGPAGRLVVEGGLPDQSALFGLLACVRDTGLAVVSVEIIPPSGKETTMNTNLIHTILKAVAVAMGAAAAVLSILGSASFLILLLGIGLFCLSAASLEKQSA